MVTSNYNVKLQFRIIETIKMIRSSRNKNACKQAHRTNSQLCKCFCISLQNILVKHHFSNAIH